MASFNTQGLDALPGALHVLFPMTLDSSENMISKQSHSSCDDF